MKWIGSKLKELVKKAHITQEQLAASIGVSRITVISWMKDQVPKGTELMKLCTELNVAPETFFEDDVQFSRPRNRMKAHAKATKDFENQTDDFVKEFSSFFSEDMSDPLQLTVNYHKKTDPLTIACKLRELTGLTDSSPIKLKKVFDLASKLGIFIVPVIFPEWLDRKTSALYTFFYDCNKVIFVKNTANGIDLVYFLLHEICHAIINGKNDIDSAEEEFCEATARATQFPERYVSDVFNQIKGRLKNTGIVIKTLKEISINNHHSLYGIAKALDKQFDTRLASNPNINICGADANLRKTTPTLKDLLISDASDNGSVKLFINKFYSFTPLYFEKVILSVYKDVSDRKLCELLGLSDITNVEELRIELERCANAVQTGCSY